MKIDFVTSFFPIKYGGAEFSIELLSKSLIKRAVRLRIITTRKLDRREENVFAIPNTYIIPKKFMILGNSIIDKFISKNLEKLIENDKPDLLHIQDMYILPAAVAVAKKLSIPVVVTVRNNILQPYHISFPFSYMLHIRDHTLLKFLKKVNAIISVSEYIKSELTDAGIDSNKVYTIYNLHPSRKSVAQKKYSKKVILFAPGRLSKEKGFNVLIKALKLVTQKKKYVELFIAGDGPERRNLEKLVKNFDLEKYVKFHGKLSYEDIMSLYTDSDIVLLSSIHPEPFGRISIEAMVAGKPVIASNIGGIPEIVENGVTGILVPPNNPKEFADAIIKLIEDENLRKEMGKNGRKIVNDKFNSKKITDQTIELYQQVIDSYE